MALCSEACVSGGESTGSEAGSSCIQFGVRSYLHHFYEECSSSVWERDPEREDRGSAQIQRSTLWWSTAVWKLCLVLGLLILTMGVVTLSIGYSTPHKIESFGEGDLFFVDSQAISFNRELHLSTVAGIVLSCLGSALAAMGIVVILPRANLKERLFYKPRQGEQRAESWSKWRGFRDVITKVPGTQERKVPITLSKVENVQSTS